MSVSVSGMTATPWLENSLKVTFTGDANIVWSYDSAKILDEIKGQDKSILNDIVNQNKNSITETVGEHHAGMGQHISKKHRQDQDCGYCEGRNTIIKFPEVRPRGKS